MADKVQDIFGKIDALLERRDADILCEKCAEDDDIPRLTEVIECNEGAVWSGIERRGSPATGDERSVDRRYAVRRKPLAPDLVLSRLTDEQLNRLFVAIEKRSLDIFACYQLQIQDDLIKVIREELTAIVAEKL
jgi:hypothetical protein